MNLYEKTKTAAMEQGRKDYNNGKPGDPSIYGAKPHSAWAQWYLTGFNLEMKEISEAIICEN